MDFSRITNAIDVNKTSAACIAVIGAGASAGLVGNLVRSGVGRRIKLFDFDTVSEPNLSRQHHDHADIGKPKVWALSDAIHRINPEIVVEPITANFLEMNEALLDKHVAECDLLILATDRFKAQARGNQLALKHQVPALWIGLYPGATAGEIVFWHPQIDACFRCLCAKRYLAHEQAEQEQRSLDPDSDGCTIFDVGLLDAIAGMLAIGLLTRGSDNRFGRLIDALGDRNFIQVQLDPAWELAGQNPVRKYLGVADDCPAFFAWNTIVRSDPDHGFPPCPDCHRYRTECALTCHGVPLRIKQPPQAFGG